MKLVLLAVCIILSACTPIKDSEEYQTKYPDAPTMQAAEDATTGKLFKD